MKSAFCSLYRSERSTGGKWTREKRHSIRCGGWSHGLSNLSFLVLGSATLYTDITFQFVFKYNLPTSNKEFVKSIDINDAPYYEQSFPDDLEQLT